MGLVHKVDRSNVYEHVMKMYSMNRATVEEYPFYAEFINEKGVDVGGVSRDMFSAFYEHMYVKLFDGSTLLHPAVHSSIDMNAFEVIGRVFSHAYLVCGIIPDKIAFPCLSAIFLGPGVAIPEEILQESFLSSLSIFEASNLSEALKLGSDASLTTTVQDSLSVIFANNGCREIPNSKNLHRLIIEASRYAFITKPAAAGFTVAFLPFIIPFGTVFQFVN